jgi:hypothetical protein
MPVVCLVNHYIKFILFVACLVVLFQHQSRHLVYLVFCSNFCVHCTSFVFVKTLVSDSFMSQAERNDVQHTSVSLL